MSRAAPLHGTPGVCLQPGNSAGALADRRRGDVVHPGEDENEAIERAKAPAPLRADGDQREAPALKREAEEDWGKERWQWRGRPLVEQR